ncbi:MAG: zinc ribbon domain-containing protein [Candidatus Binatus sp.]
MPACGQCGKDNPEGTVFCGYCATPLAKPAGEPKSPKPSSGNPAASPPLRGSSPQSKPFKAELRTPVIRTSSPTPSGDGKGKGGFEWIPWSELSAGQRAGRVIAGAVVLLLIFFFVSEMLRNLAGIGVNGTAPSAQSSDVPITPGDRKDGIESLCKVFQIYGLPKNDHDATEAARNASELFKLAGNQSPERSSYILTTIAGEFRSGKLGQPDCAEAGAPLATTDQSSDSSTPDVNRDSNQ